MQYFILSSVTLLRYFVKEFFLNIKTFPTPNVLEVRITYIICLDFCKNVLTFSCLNENINVWNLREICKICMKPMCEICHCEWVMLFWCFYLYNFRGVLFSSSICVTYVSDVVLVSLFLLSWCSIYNNPVKHASLMETTTTSVPGILPRFDRFASSSFTLRCVDSKVF